MLLPKFMDKLSKQMRGKYLDKTKNIEGFSNRISIMYGSPCLAKTKDYEPNKQQWLLFGAFSGYHLPKVTLYWSTAGDISNFWGIDRFFGKNLLDFNKIVPSTMLGNLENTHGNTIGPTFCEQKEYRDRIDEFESKIKVGGNCVILAKQKLISEWEQWLFWWW